MKTRVIVVAMACVALTSPVSAQDVKPNIRNPDESEPTKKVLEDRLELLEDGTEFFIKHLDNNGGKDGSVAARNETTFFSGTCSLSVSSFQRFRTNLPGWRYKIAENPAPGEFRYIRFAWKRSEAAGILLQFFTLAKTWEGYYAGTISPRIQRPMIRIADEPPRKWEVVTRDLFQDFGPITITGINFSAMEGPGEAYFDHIYLARTVEDLDRVTASAAKAADSVDGQVSPVRSTLVLAIAVGAFVVVIVAAAFFVLVIRRRSRSRQPAPATHVGPIPDERSAAIIFRCAGCGKKLKVTAASAGKTIHCPHCNKSTLVAGTDATP